MQNLQKQKLYPRYVFVALSLWVNINAACGGAPWPHDMVCPSAHALAMVEIMADPVGVDTGKEWLEIYNTTTEPINLQGFGLGIETTHRYKSHQINQALWVDAHAYIVLGNGDMGQVPIDYSYGHGFDLPNHSATLRLLCGEQVIDEVAYGVAAAIPVPRPGASLSLPNKTSLAADLADFATTAWCHTQYSTYDGENLGTPGLVNETCYMDTCMDTAHTRRLRHTPKVGDLQITKVYADPVGSNMNQQWLELTVKSDVSIDLAGLKLVQRSTSKKVRQWHVPIDDCQHVSALSRVYIGLVQKHAEFVGWPKVFTTAVGSQQLFTGASYVALLVGDTLIDEIELPKSQLDVVWQRL